MRTIDSNVYFSNREKLAEKFPFTVRVNGNGEQHILICENLRTAVQYCVEFIKSAPIYLNNEYKYIKRIDIFVMRTDGNFNLIKDFVPQKLNWNISDKVINLTFRELRMSDGVRLKAYLNQLRGLVLKEV